MIQIHYKPYVGLLYDDKFVHTKCGNDGLLHFFQSTISGDIHYDDFKNTNVEKIKDGKVDGIKYLGYVELKNV